MIRRISILSLLAPALFWACAPSGPPPEPLSSPTFDRALALLQTQATSTDPAVRANVIEALETSRDPRAMEVIEQGLHDKEWVVRFAAAMASGKRKAETVRPVLNTLVTTDPNGSVRAACVYACHRLGDDSHMSDLAELLVALDPSIRANTALVFGMIGEPSALPVLERRAGSSIPSQSEQDVRVKFEITAAEARLGDEAAQQVIVSWAINRFAEDQWNAMAVCADLPPRIATSPLLLGLEDAPPKLPPDADRIFVTELITRRQLVAARSLAKLKINNERAAQVAIDNLKNPSAQDRALAVLALGDMLAAHEAPKIDYVLDDPDPAVRLAAAAAVVNIYGRVPASGH